MEIALKIKDKFLKYERYLMPAALVSGFLWDSITLRRIDLWLENAAMLSYLALVFLGMSFFNAFEEGRLRNRAGLLGRELAPFLMQFAFGGLFSAFLIFYSRSAALFTGWPFLLGLFWLLVGNEFFRERYQRLVFHLSVFFAALFSYAIFALPIFTGKMGAVVFLASGFLSLVLIACVAAAFRYISPQRMRAGKRALFFSIGAVYIMFNVFYFTNLIPPVPLALKNGGVYHFVERLDAENYRVSYEPGPDFWFWRQESSLVHFIKGEPVYVFSAVFAPTRLDTVIYHQWSYFDENRKKWVLSDRLSFPIYGGRDGGYRGFTQKSNIFPGRWRVDVENSRGQVLGRINFTAVETTEPPRLETALR